MKTLQTIIPLDRSWEPEQIFNNFQALISELRWKDFEFNYDADMFERKGYLVFRITWKNDKKDTSSIILWKNKFQINYPNTIAYDICFAFLIRLLEDNIGNILLETFWNKYRAEGELPIEFQKASVNVALSLYLELVNGEIPRERIDSTKKMVKSVLVSMVEALDEIGTED